MEFQIIAESVIHPGRRLLVGSDGDGYIQLELGTAPIAVPEHDFVRLLAMRHYRFVQSDLDLALLEASQERIQVAD
jgi:hypothetical protein